jgi:hypothetical protein
VSLVRFRTPIIFFSRLRREIRRGPPAATLDALIRAVVVHLHVDPAELPARTRRHTLARALIAWRAFHNQITTLTAVAGLLQRHPASLHSAIQRQRRKHPELFAQPLRNLLRASDPRESELSACPLPVSGEKDSPAIA